MRTQANSKQGFTAIHFAARVGDLESVKALLAAGVDINIPTQAEGSANRGTSQLGIPKTVGALGYTPLLVAAVRGEMDPRYCCWITARTQQHRGRALRRCIGRRPMGKLYRQSRLWL